MYDPVNFECWINDKTRKGSLLPKGNKASGERITTARAVWRGGGERKRKKKKKKKKKKKDPEEDGETGRTITSKEKKTYNSNTCILSTYDQRATS